MYIWYIWRTLSLKVKRIVNNNLTTSSQLVTTPLSFLFQRVISIAVHFNYYNIWFIITRWKGTNVLHNLCSLLLFTSYYAIYLYINQLIFYFISVTTSFNKEIQFLDFKHVTLYRLIRYQLLYIFSIGWIVLFWIINFITVFPATSTFVLRNKISQFFNHLFINALTCPKYY